MVAVNYDWDETEDNIVEEYDDAGAMVAEYTTEPDLYGYLISQDRSGFESQYHFDALGSTRAITNDGQLVTDNYGITAFGELVEHVGITPNPYQYVGQLGYFTDGLTADNTIRFRTYRASHARWMSIDPSDLSWRDNPYGYSLNNPTVLLDASGLEVCGSRGEVKADVTVVIDFADWVSKQFPDAKDRTTNRPVLLVSEPALAQVDAEGKHQIKDFIKEAIDVEFGGYGFGKGSATVSLNALAQLDTMPNANCLIGHIACTVSGNARVRLEITVLRFTTGRWFTLIKVNKPIKFPFDTCKTVKPEDKAVSTGKVSRAIKASPFEEYTDATGKVFSPKAKWPTKAMFGDFSVEVALSHCTLTLEGFGAKVP